MQQVVMNHNPVFAMNQVAPLPAPLPAPEIAPEIPKKKKGFWARWKDEVFCTPAVWKTFIKPLWKKKDKSVWTWIKICIQVLIPLTLLALPIDIIIGVAMVAGSHCVIIDLD